MRCYRARQTCATRPGRCRCAAAQAADARHIATPERPIVDVERPVQDLHSARGLRRSPSRAGGRAIRPVRITRGRRRFARRSRPARWSASSASRARARRRSGAPILRLHRARSRARSASPAKTCHRQAAERARSRCAAPRRSCSRTRIPRSTRARPCARSLGRPLQRFGLAAAGGDSAARERRCSTSCACPRTTPTAIRTR